MENTNKKLGVVTKLLFCKKCNKETTHMLIGQKFTTSRYWICTKCKHTKFM